MSFSRLLEPKLIHVATRKSFLVSWSIRTVVMMLLMFVGTASAYADSPLTSTPFHRAYTSVDVVRMAKDLRVLKGKALKFLLQKEPLPLKAAVVNALGWKFRGQNNGLRFASALAEEYNTTLSKLTVKQISAEHAFVLGYLLAMDDYFRLKAIKPGASGLMGADALTLLKKAQSRLSDDFTVQMVYALARSQKVMKKSFCDVYLITQKVLDQFAPSKRNMRPAAVQIITKYTRLYKSSCKHLQPKIDPRYNQVYKVVRYRKWVVTGSQAGITFFNAKTGKVDLLHKAFISNTIVVVGNHLWAGTYRTLVRFDGLKATRVMSLRRVRGIDVYATPGGDVIAKAGRRFWKCGGSSLRCHLLKHKGLHHYNLNMARGSYQLAFQKGTVWAVSFMNSITRVTGGKRYLYPIRSPKYPGTDPRRVITTESKQVIVADFSRGFFFYMPTKDKFVRLPIVQRKASDAAVCIKSKQLWLLHYTNGVYVKQPNMSAHYINLQHLQYMRSLFVEPNCKTVWIGGWNQLVRLRWENNQWKQKSFVVGKR